MKPSKKSNSKTKSRGNTYYSARNGNISASGSSQITKMTMENVGGASEPELHRYLIMQCKKSKDNIGLLFEPLCLTAMRLLQEKSPSVWNVLRSKMKKEQHISLTKLEAAVKHNNSDGNKKVAH